MERLRRRNDRHLYTGYLVSFVAHLGILWLMLLMLLPTGEQKDPLDLQVTVADVGAELVVLDVVIAQPELDDEPLMIDLIGDMSESSRVINNPLVTLAAGRSGEGRHHAAAGTTAGEGGGQGRATFFGTQAHGDRFVYVLDVSNSMNQGNGRRLRRAVQELLRSVDELQDGQHFYVLLFSTEMRQMFDEVTLLPQMLPATRGNKVRLRAWLESIKPDGGTQPQRALHVGLDMRPSAVFFLSDGEFNQPKPSGFFDGEALTARDVVMRTNVELIPIHSIAFEDFASSKNMSEIASLTGGEFKFVAKRMRHPLPKRETPSVVVTPRLKERRAANWLSIADRLELDGQRDKAQRYYEKILKEYPDTTAAPEARRRRKNYLAAN